MSVFSKRYLPLFLLAAVLLTVDRAACFPARTAARASRTDHRHPRHRRPGAFDARRSAGLDRAWKSTRTPSPARNSSDCSPPFSPPADAWRTFIEIDETEARIQTGNSPADPVFHLRFAPAESAATPPLAHRRRTSRQPLRKNRSPVSKIAIDPGHIGGEWAKMEERWFIVGTGTPVQEGDMTLHVANLLKPRLEALGATVSLVRDKLEPVTPIRPDSLLSLAKDAATEFPAKTRRAPVLPHRGNPRPRRARQHHPQARPRPLPPLQRRSLGRSEQPHPHRPHPPPSPAQRRLHRRGSPARRPTLRPAPETPPAHPPGRSPRRCHRRRHLCRNQRPATLSSTRRNPKPSARSATPTSGPATCSPTASTTAPSFSWNPTS